MLDAYTNAFFTIVQETQKDTGYDLPVHLEHYIVMVLAIHIDKPIWQPESSFAEKILTIDNKSNAKQLGDTCLFVSGVFPKYGSKKGLPRSYYQNIGKTSYSQISGQLFSDLSLHFNFLSEFIEISTQPKNLSTLQNQINL
jgi:hypothetical protein